MTRVTINKVNAAVRALGGAEELVRGNGYFWFADGNAPGWYSQSVPVYSLNQLTLDQWVEAYKELRDNPRNH